MALPKEHIKPKKPLNFFMPNFNSRFERVRYTVFMIIFPSIAVIAITALVLVNMNAATDYQRTELIIIGLNNTYIANENSMIRDCEQDARIDFLGGLSVEEIENNIRDCLLSIPFHDRAPDDIEIIIKTGDGDA